MSNVPMAVRKQAEKAKKLHDEMYGKGQDTGAEPTPQPTNDAAQQANQQPAAPQQPAPSGDSYEARYKTLEGKYKAEVPRLQEKIRQLEERLKAAGGDTEVAALQTQNQELQQQVQQTQQELDKARQELDRVRGSLTDEFGQSVTDDIGALARGEAQEAARSAAAEAQAAQMNAFLASIKAVFGDFSEINDSPEFSQWLDTTVDEDTGRPMRVVVQRAYDRADDIQFIRYVRRFLSNQAAPDDPMHNQSQQTANGMDDLVAPPRGNQHREVSEKPTFTPADYERHNNEKIHSRGFTRGPWAGREAEWRAQEQVIHAAVNAQQ